MVETKKASTESPSPSNTAMTEFSTEEEKPKKSRMLKIRGFLTGKSRRRKDAKKESKNGENRGADSKSKTDGDDNSTVYGVNVDDGTHDPATLAAKNKLLNKDGEEDEESDLFDDGNKGYLLKVVLLLMDAKSRRFELLQLEFDSIKATVADVLAQIPVAVTEECLQEQSYEGITCSDGQEKNDPDVLADFCKGGDVMVAIASGMSAAECVKLALPILSDSKVIAMVSVN